MPLKIIRQDITKIECDAIVNPTNCDMLPGGGTDAAIHAAAGAELLEFCRGLGGCPVGEAKITPAFNLPCSYVIHTVGPEWEGGMRGERLLLRSCYEQSLKLAVEHNCTSIAFPLISSGLYGYPKDKVLSEATDVIGDFLDAHEIDVYILVYDKTSYSISRELYSEVQTFIDNFYVETHSDMFDNFREAEIFRAMRLGEIQEGLAEDDCLLEAAEAPCDTFLQCSEISEQRRVQRPKRRASFSEKSAESLEDMLGNMGRSFADTLFYYIDKKEISDVEAYKRSNVGKKTFSKIKCNKDYNPSKITAVSFAIGLRLNIEETRHLLSTAGMCLSNSNKFDVIIEYFIVTGNYKTVHDVNEVLYQFDQSLLGV